MSLSRNGSWVVNQWAFFHRCSRRTYIAGEVSNVVFQRVRRAAGRVQHDSDYQRTLSSRKCNA